MTYVGILVRCGMRVKRASLGEQTSHWIQQWMVSWHHNSTPSSLIHHHGPNSPSLAVAPPPPPASFVASSVSSALPTALLVPLLRVPEAFLLSDMRQPHHPIVHASQTFLDLTGYSRCAWLQRVSGFRV